MVGDFHHAEDVVQEALVAAWSSLPRLADPAAFPGWLRSIVQHHAFRVIRRKHLAELPLDAGAGVARGEAASDERIEQRQQIRTVLAAIEELPARLREPATLFYMHECSHQDIALFLGLTATTVNNRLHDELAPVDTVIHLSRGLAVGKIYPCVDVATSRSRLIDTGAVHAAHAAIAARARECQT